ncbi:MAG: CBS domain-containing protein [Deltaproteobacteria bacterium]|nr:CBS domain-containing protein [Deltaproteobacteria bacterium]
MKLRESLDKGPRAYFSLDATKSAEDAIRLMAEKHVSAVIVTEGGAPVGIFTERDVLRCYVKCGERPYDEIALKEAMTNKLIVGKPEDEVGQVISLMVEGMVYLCDLLHDHVGTLSTEIRYLEEYLRDLQDAVTD